MPLVSREHFVNRSMALLKGLKMMLPYSFKGTKKKKIVNETSLPPKKSRAQIMLFCVLLSKTCRHMFQEMQFFTIVHVKKYLILIFPF